jgi:HD domain
VPIFSDLLYGRIELPAWIDEFVRLPEFARLRGVRLSNVDSFEFKDLSNPARWEHCVAVAYLALRCAQRRQLSQKEAIELTLAGLLHDVATPPFAHTAEQVLPGFSHELETQLLLTGQHSENSDTGVTILGAALPRFLQSCESLNRRMKLKIEPDEIARLIVGEGKDGFLIAGTLDLDNADNVTRGCSYMGMDVSRTLPLRVADWLATLSAPPLDLKDLDEPVVKEWLENRRMYYGAFYNASDAELGRQAFLEHLMRRGLRAGLPTRVLIWSTDEALLASIENSDQNRDPSRVSLRELVQRYRLLEAPRRIAAVPIAELETLRALRHPDALTWIEDRLTGPHLESFVTLSVRRFAESEQSESLFPAAAGVLHVYKLGGDIERRHLPDWMGVGIPAHYKGAPLRTAIAAAIERESHDWAKTKPWAQTRRKQSNTVDALRAAGDWSFRSSRNLNLHTYPGTFVHAIPAALIGALGLRGEIVLDPFGGTGQTAAEVLRSEGRAISADSNTIATLITRAKFTYLDRKNRDWLRLIEEEVIRAATPVNAPEFELRSKWHHPKTLKELCLIRGFIDETEGQEAKAFLLAAFSATITAGTARKGKQHGFFADNTPLPADLEKPPYEDALRLFVDRVQKNLAISQQLYASIERRGGQPRVELKRVSVRRVDVRNATPKDYGLNAGEAAAIITSPPYLCMADYALGQRLSYYWIAPDALAEDYEMEIGARRSRSHPAEAVTSYFESIEAFASLAKSTLRSGGFLATVLGAPLAANFAKVPVMKRFDDILATNGFQKLWEQWRPIHWHRNQGYQRLLEERVTVHVRA